MKRFDQREKAEGVFIACKGYRPADLLKITVMIGRVRRHGAGF
jgi:hypothetical protein